jgi:hypothetical protein
MSEELLPSDQTDNSQKNENDEWRKLLIALLFLLLSFSCVFCSSQTALWVIDRDRIEASMRSLLTADYGRDPLIALAPLNDEIIAEAARDEELLSPSQTPISQGIAVAILPNPLPTPVPTPTPVFITPAPRPTVATPAPTSAPPEATEEASPPTSLPPTSPPSFPTTAPPIPTDVPSSPTSSPPTVPPPTSPPPTSPPATSPPPTSPPSRPTDIPIPPAVAFSAAGFSVNEGDGVATITVILSNASDQTVWVDYATNGITATSGDDYTDVNGTLTFNPGQISQTFDVPIIDDNLANEADEQVQLTLSNPSNATLGTPNPAILTIVDNDGRPTVQFDQPNYRVDEGVGSAVITATLSAPSAIEVTVVYSSTDITAKAGEDYTGVNDTLTFAPGQLSVTFTVPITDDDVTNEGDEQIRLTLSAPTSATLGSPNPTTLTIEDNDGEPTVGFIASDFSVNEGDDGGTGIVPAQIQVALSAPSAVTVTVDYATSDGLATDGSDYTAISGTLTFDPGQIDQSFVVSVISDTLVEGTETVQLALTTPVSATLGTASATLHILDDDPPSPSLDCSGDPLPSSEPNVGPPDGLTFTIACGTEIVVDLNGTPVRTSGTNNYDLVYYELGQSNPPTITSFIYMDWLVVQIGQTDTGPWYTVFYWGDNIVDTNSNIASYVTGTEDNNLVIPTSNLYGTAPYNTGITIDIDARAPAGTYQYVRLFAPGGPDPSPPLDAPNIDAVEVPVTPIPP